ncbi:hypothetical protein E2562_004209 [Oryza meyeriana var. granulata]|uniref:ubiquitinyl hydrolase 1 n=1 Tax=Oryza meyeriana var. granulata TaxID=110450 RepID=A0A6G1BSI7_9ORYZ|nr:hypothetical protein E2562_004209 [Oryza meyeriana var. granulata]
MDCFLKEEQEQRGWDSDLFSLEWELTRLRDLTVTSDDSTRSQTTLDDWSKTDDNRSGSCKLRHKKPIVDLAVEFEDNIIIEKITLLSQKYDFFRPVDRDGSCFYRAFIFSYMEHIVEMQDDLERNSEAARIEERIGKYKQDYERFGIPQEEFLKALSAFEQLTNLIEIRLDVGPLYQIHEEIDIATNSEVLRFLRFLTEIEICTNEDYYKGFVTVSEECASVFEFCQVEVRPENSEANSAQIVALVNALGIPLLVENLDTSLVHGCVLLNQHFFYPRPESEEGTMLEPLNYHDSVSSESSSCHAAIGAAPMELQNLPSTSGSSTNGSTETLGLQSMDTSSTPSLGDADAQNGNGERTIDDLSPAERRRMVEVDLVELHYLAQDGR